MKMAIVWLIGMSMSLILVLLALSLIKFYSLNKSKNNSFECGFHSLFNSHGSFSFQFFFISILFLIFDVEISLMISYPIEFFSFKKKVVILFFVLMMLLILIFEWESKKMDWMT